MMPRTPPRLPPYRFQQKPDGKSLTIDHDRHDTDWPCVACELHRLSSALDEAQQVRDETYTAKQLLHISDLVSRLAEAQQRLQVTEADAADNAKEVVLLMRKLAEAERAREEAQRQNRGTE